MAHAETPLKPNVISFAAFAGDKELEELAEDDADEVQSAASFA